MRTLLVMAALGLLAACGAEDPLQRMQVQPKYVWYNPNPIFADGRAMRTPPEGTVPRERLEKLSIQSARGPDGQYLTSLPVKLTPELMAQGRKRFNIVCATCHGLAGDGQSMAARNMALRPPPSIHLAKYQGKPPGYFYDVITNGYGLMASYANEISDEERWAVVAYMQALQLSQNATLDKAPAAERAKLEASK